MKKLGKYLLVLSWLFITFTTALADIPTGVPDIDGKSFKVFGYSISAKNALLEPVGNEQTRTFKLSLFSIDKQFLWAADRPHRHSGHVTPEEFMTRWSNQDVNKGYAINPPNGSIAGSIKGGKQIFVMHGTFKSANYDSTTQTLTFNFVPFEGSDAFSEGKMQLTNVHVFVSGHAV